jgi:cytochrome bd-type quinol oxidase subunit 2
MTAASSGVYAAARALRALAVLQRGGTLHHRLGVLVISTFPYIVPPSISVWIAAAAVPSQHCVLAGIAILLPFILRYTLFGYYTFRGKGRADEGYH